MTTLRPSDALTAAIAFAWYASADLIPSRTARIAAKAGLLIGGTVAVGVLERDAITEQAAAQDHPTDPSAPPETVVAAQAAADTAPGIGSVAAVVASGLAVDQVMRLLSRRRRAQGKRFAHLPSAALAGGYTLAVTPWMRRIEARVGAGA